MIYTVETTSKIGKPVEVYDANGRELNCLVECDTETGRCVYTTKRIVNGKVELIEAFEPAPLRVYPKRSNAVNA